MTDHLVHTTESMQPRNPKRNSLQHIYSHSETSNRVSREIYSIKDETNDRTEEEIKRLIRSELDLVENDIQVWSRMILAISQFKLSGNINQLDKSTFIFNQTTLTC